MEHHVEVAQGKHQVGVEQELGTHQVAVVVGVAYLLLVAMHQVVVVVGKLQVVVAEEGTHQVVAALQVVEEEPVVVLQEQTLVVVVFLELVDILVVPFAVFFSRIAKQKHSQSSSDTKRW